MKAYKKNLMLAVRINELMETRLNLVQEQLKLDRADLIRMFINNGLKYWEGIRTKDNLQIQYQAVDHGYTNQDLEHIAKIEVAKEFHVNNSDRYARRLAAEAKRKEVKASEEQKVSTQTASSGKQIKKPQVK
jgi:hypothetical protein